MFMALICKTRIYPWATITTFMLDKQGNIYIIFEHRTVKLYIAASKNRVSVRNCLDRWMAHLWEASARIDRKLHESQGDNQKSSWKHSSRRLSRVIAFQAETSWNKALPCEQRNHFLFTFCHVQENKTQCIRNKTKLQTYQCLILKRNNLQDSNPKGCINNGKSFFVIQAAIKVMITQQE